ncbi:hypothetical protein ACO9S2_10575 [Nitrospira sp. NS4]|uniref:hypothetical protein n=1 Tax=Nitrospira sp. NS4 TaxID=3414498 RepID=UPI003C2FDA4B
MFDASKGSRREVIDQDERERLLASNTLFVDTRRRRPKYFDGRFLTARDLTRDQTYFLTRQADLGRSMGAGVVTGLMVEEGETATSLHIQPGLGVTPSGEIVSVPSRLTLDLADIPSAQRLNAALGLSLRPLDPARSRSGLFVLALRPVEFTANPIASYPTSITGPRSVEDGEIIEATAATLIPFPDEGDASEWNRRRSRVAHQVFVERATRGLPAGVLPLAMVAVDRNIIQWLDPFLVRRELAVWQGEVLGLGLGTKALRYAQVQQYEAQLQDVLRDRGTRGQRFAAADHFLALPPVGRLPLASIDLTDFSQIYFPPEIEVELSVIPDDEVPVLLEESLILPPIDLTLSENEQDSTSVLILVPVDRTRLDELKARLTTIRRPFKVAAPGLVAKRSPLELLQGLRLPRLALPTAPVSNPQDAAWREAVQLAAGAATGLLWYVRRRNLSTSAEGAGTAVPLSLVVQPPVGPTGLGVATAPILSGISPITDIRPISPVVQPSRTAAPSKARRKSTPRRKG